MLHTWRSFVVSEDDVVDDSVDTVVEKIDSPTFVSHDIIHALLCGVTGSFHCIPGNVARAGDAVAHTHVDRISRVTKMPDILQVLRKPGRLRKMKSTGG